MSSATDAPDRELSRFEKRRLKNREALIEAAIELFQSKGLRETKIEEICELADVSPRTFFNHFETREHLYAAISEQRTVPLREAFEAAAVAEGDLAERLTTLFGRIGEYLGARPAYRELIGTISVFTVDGQGTLAARSRPYHESARVFVDAGVERGDVTSRHDPDVLADIILGTLFSAINNWSADEAFDIEHELIASARALLDVLSTDRASATR